jgi:hypothetical protein
MGGFCKERATAIAMGLNVCKGILNLHYPLHDKYTNDPCNLLKR